MRGEEEHQRGNDKQEFGSELDEALDVIFRDESGTKVEACVYATYFIESLNRHSFVDLFSIVIEF